jgi:hypothetical protein
MILRGKTLGVCGFCARVLESHLQHDHALHERDHAAIELAAATHALQQVAARIVSS